jgi:hypothetical protein
MIRFRRFLGRTIFLLILVGGVGGCDTLNFKKGMGQDPLAGKQTFSLLIVSMNGPGILTGAGSTATQAAGEAILDIFEGQGYVYQATGPADMKVIATWQYGSNMNSLYFHPQVGAAPATTAAMQHITLTIMVRDGSSDKLLWSGDTPFPVAAGALTAQSAVTLVRQGLTGLPSQRPAPTPPTPVKPKE